MYEFDRIILFITYLHLNNKIQIKEKNVDSHIQIYPYMYLPMHSQFISIFFLFLQIYIFFTL